MSARMAAMMILAAMVPGCSETDTDNASLPKAATATAPPLTRDRAESAALPAGHPPISTAKVDGSGAGGAAGAMPAGHPPISGAGIGGVSSIAEEVPATPDGRITMRNITAELPDGWKATKPKSSMRAAQISLPPAEGESGEASVVVTYFGPNGAGPKEANLKRWAGQFAGDPEALYKQAKIADVTVGDFQMTTFVLSGTLQGGSMPGMPAASERAGHRMFAAIVNTDEGPYYIKATGPEKTMAAQADAMNQFLASLQKKK